MYRIGLFSQITKVTVKTLRYYDSIDLIKLKKIDEQTGYRYYTSDQIDDMYKILCFKQLGLSIQEIKNIINDNQDNIEEVLKKKKQEIMNYQVQFNNQLSLINYLLKEKKEGYFMEYNPIIKKLPSCIVYYKEMMVPDYNSYFTLIPEIGEKVTKANPDLKLIEPEYCFIKYLENEYKEKDIHIEFNEAVDKIGQEVDDIKFKKIESVDALCIMHKGAYKDLNKAYSFAFKWIEENGYELSDSPRESYIDGIWNKENEEDWLTEVQFPIKKKIV